jgi:zinc/manganese transport system substrate-binding protein
MRWGGQATRTRSGLTSLSGRVALAALAAAVVAGCGSDAGESNAEPSAVATTTQVADLVQNVGGERVAVHRFLAPNADPHEYEPRPSDAEAVFEADVVFRSGGDLDDWLSEVLDNAGGDAEEVTLIEAIPTGRLRGAGELAGEGAEAVDPHWWQDPRNAILVVEAIADALAAADPGGADAYRRNADRYAARLEQLDRGIARCIRLVPPDQRKLVTTHDSYGYFADRYGIEVVGALIPSSSSQAQPSAGATVELTEQIDEEGVKAIFPESALDPRLERAVADETGATVGEALWADSLGPEGSDGDTYVGALAADTAALVEGMTGGERSCRPRA